MMVSKVVNAGPKVICGSRSFVCEPIIWDGNTAKLKGTVVDQSVFLTGF